MLNAAPNGALTRVGTEVINSQRVPVLLRADSNVRYVEAVDVVTGKLTLVTLDGAKTFKKNPCPLHPELEALYAGTVLGDDRPFALTTDEEQESHAAKMLRALLERVTASGVGFQFAEN